MSNTLEKQNSLDKVSYTYPFNPKPTTAVNSYHKVNPPQQKHCSHHIYHTIFGANTHDKMKVKLSRFELAFWGGYAQLHK